MFNSGRDKGQAIHHDQNTSLAEELTTSSEKGTNKRLRRNSDRRVKYTAEGSKTSQTHQRVDVLNTDHKDVAVFRESSRIFTQPKPELDYTKSARRWPEDLEWVYQQGSFRSIVTTTMCHCSYEQCEGEVLVIRPHLLSESAQGYLLLNLREDEGQEEVLEDKDEEEKESEVDEKVKEVRENAQLMHATWG